MPRPLDAAHRHGRRRALAAVLVLAMAAAAPPVAAGAGEPADPPPTLDAVFGEVIDVRVVNLEAVVTDRRGDRVASLGPGDFRLLVDGEEVAIDYFTEVRDGRAVAATGPEPAVAGVPAAAAGEAVPTSYLVFVDDVFTLGRDRDRAVRALAEGIDRMRPGDRMAVVAYAQGGLDLLAPLTGSRAELEEALRRLETRPARGLLRFATYRQLAANVPAGMGCALLRLAAEKSERESGHAPSVEPALARTGHDESWLERVMAAAAASMRAFPDPPGRKVLMLLAGGWRPDVALAFGGGALTDQLAMQRLFAPLTETANLLGYSIYPVDVAGAVTTFGADVEAGAGSGASPFGLNRVLDDNLRYLAERTGGLPLLDRARFDPLPRVAEDTRSFYWLGFTPARSRDDRLHRVRVEAVAPGLRVRARRDFRDLSPLAQTAMAVESALLFGELPPAGGLEVVAGPPLSRGRNAMEVPLEVAVPLDAVTALPAAGGGSVVRLDLLVATEDDRGRRSDVVTVPIELTRLAPPGAGGTARYRTSLELRARPHELLVAVHDPVARQTLFGRAAVAP